MDAARALADLTEISTQIRAAVVLEADGSLLGSTLADEKRGGQMAAAARRLLDEAASVASAGEASPPAQLQVSMPEGSVFVVREGGRTIVATAAADPTIGLVFYDLKSCLRRLADEDAKPKPKPRARRATRKPPAKKDSDAAS